MESVINGLVGTRMNKKWIKKKFLLLVSICNTVTYIIIVAFLYYKTKISEVLLCGVLLYLTSLVFEIISSLYLNFQLKSATSDLCNTIDELVKGNCIITDSLEEETMISKIKFKLRRLYLLMEEKQLNLNAQKENLQAIVSDISHQTKNTIMNLKLLNETLSKRNASREKQQELLLATANQLDKLEFFMLSLVKISRLETGIITLKKSTVPILETIATSINSVLSFLEDKNIDLTIDCMDDLSVCHDPRWTSEAIYNILDNAIKYTAPRGRISIQAGSNEMYVIIQIKDTGRGIPECEHASIFKRFYREAAVHDISGLGIGLYLSRKIITMQGGYISLKSQVGKGSNFIIHLPKT